VGSNYWSPPLFTPTLGEAVEAVEPHVTHGGGLLGRRLDLDGRAPLLLRRLPRHRSRRRGGLVRGTRLLAPPPLLLPLHQLLLRPLLRLRLLLQLPPLLLRPLLRLLLLLLLPLLLPLCSGTSCI
jgi:hypothetical protein